MQERNVLALVVVLVVATAGAGVAVNAFRSNNANPYHAFNLALDLSGTAVVGASLQIRVTVQQAFIDARTLPSLFISVDIDSLSVVTATPSSNPWGSATVWNLTGLDLAAPRVYNITASATVAGNDTLFAMVWEPLGDLRSVSVDPSGHVNPAGVSLLASDSAPIDVSPTG